MIFVATIAPYGKPGPLLHYVVGTPGMLRYHLRRALRAAGSDPHVADHLPEQLAQDAARKGRANAFMALDYRLTADIRVRRAH